MKVTPTNVEELAERKQDENWDLRAFLKHGCPLESEELDELVREITLDIWKRIDCTACGRCCEDLCPRLTEQEQDRLATRLGVTTDELRERYLVRGPEPDEPAWRMRDAPCPFLQDGRCRVYEDRPAECREYPYLLKPDFAFRTIAMVERTSTCPLVYEVLEELKESVGFDGWR